MERSVMFMDQILQIVLLLILLEVIKTIKK